MAPVEANSDQIESPRSNKEVDDLCQPVRMRNVEFAIPNVERDNRKSQQGEVAVEREGPIQSLLAKLRAIAKAASDRKEHRVLVVDDSVLPRAAARTMLGTATGLRLVGEASSGLEALQAMGRLKADLVLMDVHMSGMDGPAATKELLSQHPETKVIAWTVSESSDDLLRMMRAGCAGYVLKDAGPSELQRALWAAVRSESPVPRKMIPDVLKRVAERTPLSQAATVPLTSREMQVLRGLAKGLPTKRLAKELGLQESSI